MKIELDKWLTEIFGYPVYKVIPPAIPPADMSLFTRHLPTALQAFYYAKLSVAQLALTNQFVAVGFRNVDVNVTFVGRPTPYTVVPIRVREARPTDEAQVLAIAESCFIYSRFHLDPLLSTELANKIKRAWVANYFRGERGEKVFVAVKDDEVLGFNAVLKVNEQVRAIDLIGVDKKFQGQGVGRALVQSFLTDSAEQYAQVCVGTQIANTPSMNLYESCGFKIQSAAYVLHAHIQNGKVLQ